MQWSISMRPHTFSEMYGCEPVKKYFYNITAKKKPYPMLTLFQGRYGGGKTTSAKILAQMISCTSPKENGDPCCECPACKEIINESFHLDCIQLDAGQSGKDDVINKVTDFVSRPSIRGNHQKVMIIEEVQELSKAAKNALLKVTEKPKENIHFILTSMEPLESGGLTSRCVKFNFEEAEQSDIINCMAGVLQKAGLFENKEIIGTENPIQFWGPLLGLIAFNSEGSYRNAIQDLDQCVNMGIYTEAEATKVLSYTSEQSLSKALLSLLSGNITSDTYATLFYGDTLKKFTDTYKLINNAYMAKAFGKSFDNSPNIRALASDKNFSNLASVYEKIYMASQNPKVYIPREIYISEICRFADLCKLSPQGVTPVRTTGRTPV
jgi:DNA polymerase-3 subunit gamma/tau